MRLKLHYAFLILFCSIRAMPKRDRDNEPSGRLVECFYCNEEVRFKNLQSHCDTNHGKLKARVKGVPWFGEFFAKKQKKRHQPEVAPAPGTSQTVENAPQPLENTPPSAGNLVFRCKDRVDSFYPERY